MNDIFYMGEDRVAKNLEKLNREYATFCKAPGDMCPVCNGKPEKVLSVLTFLETEIMRLCDSCKEKNDYSLRNLKRIDNANAKNKSRD